RNSALRNLAKSLYASGINKLTESEYGDGAAYIAEATRRGDESAELFAHSMLSVQDDLTRMPNVNYGVTRFSPDGKWLVGFASAGNNMNVLQVWDAVDRKLIKQRDDIAAIQTRYPLFDGKNRAYVTTTNSNIVRYDIENDQKEDLRLNPDSSFIPSLQFLQTLDISYSIKDQERSFSSILKQNKNRSSPQQSKLHPLRPILTIAPKLCS